MEKIVIDRTAVLQFKIAEIAEALGRKSWMSTNEYLDADSYEDVYHSGYGKSDVRCWDFSEPFADAPIIFWSACARAMEDAERDSLAVALGDARRSAIARTLEKICVSGEYPWDGGYISLPKGREPCIQSVEIDTPSATVTVTVDRPEHLINDLLAGQGYFSPELNPFEKADEGEVRKLFLATIGDYFEVYGESMVDVPDRIEPSNLGTDQLGSYLSGYLRDMMSAEEAAELIKEAVDAGSVVNDLVGIQMAGETTLIPLDEIGNELLRLRKNDLKTAKDRVTSLVE